MMSSLKRITAILLAAAMLLSLAACGSQTAQNQTETKTTEKQPALPGPRKVQAADLLEDFKPQPVEEKKADEAFIRAGFDWAVRLFRQVYQDEKSQKTLLISPLSVMTALAMTANGAKGNSLKEMETALGGSLSLETLNAYLHSYLKNLPSSEKAEFSFANGIWFKDQADFVVEQDFLQKNVNYYEAAIRKAPFDDSTVQEINQWVAMHTKNMIPSLLSSLSDSDRMVLINALAFDAKWEQPFEVYGSNLAPFTNLEGKETEADYLSGEVYSYLENESCTGFMKSYEGDGYRFVALLPKNEKGFDDFVAGLDGAALKSLLAGVSEELVRIRLPRFSYDYSASLSQTLSALGIRDAFNPAAADFTRISQTPLAISDVIHKTHIDLDSEGTRAAAVTAVIVAATGILPQPPKEVNLDRPFVYMIVDTATNLPVFIGTVTGFEK